MADTLYVNDDGIADMLNAWTNHTTPSLLSSGKVRLFKNNVTVDKTTLLGALTEATYPGYSAQSVAGFSAASVSGHVATSSPTMLVFVCTGGGSTENEYGGYITDAAGTKLLCCWNFSGGPFVMFTNGDTIDVTPTVSSQSLN